MVNVTGDIEIIADHAVASIVNGCSGANEEGFHYVNVNPERDFKVSQYTIYASFKKETNLQMETEQFFCTWN